MRKFKFTTFIHKDITDGQRRDSGFLALLGILPQAYAAHLNPQPWTEDMGVRATLQDDILFESSPHYLDFHEAFEEASRMELHLHPGTVSGTLNGDIELCTGRDSGFILLFTYDFATGKATTGMMFN